MVDKEEKNGAIRIVKDGPYAVSGGLPLHKEIIVSDEEGTAVRWEKGEAYPRKERYILCRCGATKTPPYCDGSHATVGFDGTETASRVPYDQQAETTTGPDLALKDAVPLCAVARFCYRDGNTWNLTENSNKPQAKETAIQEAADCPSGRLTAVSRRTCQKIEPSFTPSIGVVEDPFKKVSGPLWVKGGVRIESSDGTAYEVRNRVTLCRCGKSTNKPFCDGTHIDVNFKDGDKTLK